VFSNIVPLNLLAGVSSSDEEDEDRELELEVDGSGWLRCFLSANNDNLH
jgi:hypothetical protein